ncbi:MAG TPA: family 1 glycosylhydrolase, partial [Terrimesophilobacter sp.]|nr:family 1 glycosylhydrolase [Terrimesophilobacter sp.]
MSDVQRFPEGFIWGAATAAHQVEGNNVNSDWWEREHAPGTDIDEPSGDACDSYHRYAEDMRLLADAGLSMYRFSVEWARIEPERDFVSFAELDHYRRMIDTARSLGLEPMVTLHHFTVPRWFARSGSWRAPDAVERFRRYVSVVSPILDEVSWVCTINEPNMITLASPTTAEEAGPQQADGRSPDLAVSNTLAQAHRAARAVLARRHGGRMRTGWSVATQAFQSAPGADAAAERFGYHRDAWFLEAARDDDWVGVQAYTRTIVGTDGPLPVPEGS